LPIGSRRRLHINKCYTLFAEGISHTGTLIDLGVEHRVLEKRGAFVAWNGELLGQGRDASKQRLRDEPELAEKLDLELRERLLLPRLTPERFPESTPATSTVSSAPTEAAACRAVVDTCQPLNLQTRIQPEDTMSIASQPRAPLWNKSTARFLGEVPKASPAALDAVHAPAARQPDEQVLARLGLKRPPSDPALLGEYLIADDAADAAIDADEFSRGVRRALRLSLAFSAGLHRRAKTPWKVWVETNFKVGYACFHRYHMAAELQVGLISRGLPVLTNEHQSRSIAPFRRHEKFWEALATFQPELPPAIELKNRLRAVLGGEALAAEATPRIKFHRILNRLVAALPPNDDDPSVIEAMALVRRALGILERGSG